MDTVLGRLRSAGFSADMTHHAYHALDSHIVGFTLWLLPYLAFARQQPDYAERFLQELPTAELPHLTEHVQVHMAPERPGDVERVRVRAGPDPGGPGAGCGTKG